MKFRPNTNQADKLGIAASVLCAIHCAAMPFLIGIFHLLGLQLLGEAWIEIVMICLSLLIGFYSLTKACIKHRKPFPIIFLLVGFLIIAAGRLHFHTSEMIMVPAGGFIIAFAHFRNLRASRACNHNQ